MNRLFSRDPNELPRVTLAQRVVDKMVANALIYDTETGESLIGLPIPVTGRAEPDLVVLTTIAPDDSAVRGAAYFEQGDDLQGDTLNWLADNWDDMRKQTVSTLDPKYNVALDHLGDWHKHPGTLTEPSWGDTDTALAHVLDHEAGKPYLLVILATVWERAAAHAETDSLAASTELPLLVEVDERVTVRLDTWYMSRRARRFVHLCPVVQPDSALPALPAVGWHLSDPARLSAEVTALKKAGFAVSVDEWDADHLPPRELCLTLARRNSDQILIVVTTAEYPAARPILRTVPRSAMKDIPQGADLFPALWSHSALLPDAAYPAFGWTSERTILELAQAVLVKETPS